MAQQKGKTFRLLDDVVEVQFDYFVAIDFGTHGTGLGYAIKETGEIYHEQDWCKNNDIKNKTDILLTWMGKFKAFGYEALDQFSL